MDRPSAKLKAEHFCAYQERSQQEVRDKLYEWKLRRDDVEEIISELILDNFLNEERFASAYVSGKFKIKRWGKIKIKQGLKQKKVPDRMIHEALNGIDANEYLEAIKYTAEKKLIMITEKNEFKRRSKLISFLQSRGFENDLIFDVLRDNNLS